MKRDKTSFNPPRGMRDFYPEDMAVRNAIFNAWSQSARLFGFQEYDSSVVESLELLMRKSGEEIVDQIYTFKDKSDRDLALRPEITPTLARMIVARQGHLSFPLKWFTIAQCFRYERMTRGRKREHYQWNLDIIGEDSVTAETEIIATAVNALSTLGFNKEDICIKFSNRALLSDLLIKIGIPTEHHQATFLALDKKGKINDEEITKLLQNEGLDTKHIAQVFDLLNIVSLEDCKRVLGEETDAYNNAVLFINTLSEYGIQDMVTFDISVVRGLSYYTGIVFEAFDTKKEFRAIFGGGRYDNLLGDIGGKPATGVGLGFGDVVIAEIMEETGKASDVGGTAAHTAIGFMDTDQHNTAINIATAMRSSGKSIDLALKAEKPKSFFSRTGKAGFKEAIYIGPDDIKNGSIRIKNLETREEQEIHLNSLC